MSQRVAGRVSKKLCNKQIPDTVQNQTVHRHLNFKVIHRSRDSLEKMEEKKQNAKNKGKEVLWQTSITMRIDQQMHIFLVKQVFLLLFCK